MHFKSTKYLLYKSTKLCYTNSLSQNIWILVQISNWYTWTPGQMSGSYLNTCSNVRLTYAHGTQSFIHLSTHSHNHYQFLPIIYTLLHVISYLFITKNHTHPIKTKRTAYPNLFLLKSKSPILPSHPFINNLFTFMTYFRNNSILYYNHKKEVSTNYLTK